MKDVSETAWRKSSRSADQGGTCVEVATVLVRSDPELAAYTDESGAADEAEGQGETPGRRSLASAGIFDSGRTDLSERVEEFASERFNADAGGQDDAACQRLAIVGSVKGGSKDLAEHSRHCVREYFNDPL